MTCMTSYWKIRYNNVCNISLSFGFHYMTLYSQHRGPDIRNVT